jgi:glycosyltransferase involved in cell wall biosynthesis
MKSIIFLDISSELDHASIKDRAIGGSEYQFYSLIDALKNKYHITCYNKKSDNSIIDSVNYKNYKTDLSIDKIDITIPIISGRYFLDYSGDSYNNIKNNKIYIWYQDFIYMDTFSSRIVFLADYPESEKSLILNDSSLFLNKILIPNFQNKNIHHVFNSNFCKTSWTHFMDIFNIQYEPERLYINFNAIYPDEFINKDENIKLKKNMIVYASGWNKGINGILQLFSYIYQHDKDFILVLMSPGYEYEGYKKYIEQIKQMFQNRVIILGPLKKIDYSKILKQAVCVLSARFPETFGCIFSEAYYLGTPVIADIQSGAVKEIIDNDYILNYDNPEIVLEKLKYLRENRENVNISLNRQFLLEDIFEKWEKILF